MRLRTFLCRLNDETIVILNSPVFKQLQKGRCKIDIYCTSTRHRFFSPVRERRSKKQSFDKQKSISSHTTIKIAGTLHG